MNRTIIGAAAVFGFLAVLLGAFGAHGLRPRLSPELMHAYETGVSYQMYHALFLFFLGLMKMEDKRWIFWLTFFGILMFSFSLYALAIADLGGMDLGAFGLITPIGGTMLAAAWFLLAYRIIRRLS